MLIPPDAASLSTATPERMLAWSWVRGAMVIVVMAPLIAPLVRKIPVSWMTGFGFSVLVCAMWYYASFNFATNYGREASARIVQGFGTASCLSRPANLPTRVRRRTKTIKRRVLRISSGIKVEGSALRFVTTVLARRAQYHQSVLVTRITNFHATFSKGAAGIANRFVDYGYSAADAAARAVAQIQAVVRRDAIVSRL